MNVAEQENVRGDVGGHRGPGIVSVLGGVKAQVGYRSPGHHVEKDSPVGNEVGDRNGRNRVGGVDAVVDQLGQHGGIQAVHETGTEGRAQMHQRSLAPDGIRQPGGVPRGPHIAKKHNDHVALGGMDVLEEGHAGRLGISDDEKVGFVVDPAKHDMCATGGGFDKRLRTSLAGDQRVGNEIRSTPGGGRRNGAACRAECDRDHSGLAVHPISGVGTQDFDLQITGACGEGRGRNIDVDCRRGAARREHGEMEHATR